MRSDIQELTLDWKRKTLKEMQPHLERLSSLLPADQLVNALITFVCIDGELKDQIGVIALTHSHLVLVGNLGERVYKLTDIQISSGRTSVFNGSWQLILSAPEPSTLMLGAGYKLDRQGEDFAQAVQSAISSTAFS